MAPTRKRPLRKARQPVTIRYNQLAPITATIANRARIVAREVIGGTGQPAIDQTAASGAPVTNRRPAAAARGLAVMAATRSPWRKAMAARVVPHVGQGIPVAERKTQGHKFGASANHNGRRAMADAAAASHSNAS